MYHGHTATSSPYGALGSGNTRLGLVIASNLSARRNILVIVVTLQYRVDHELQSRLVITDAAPAVDVYTCGIFAFNFGPLVQRASRFGRSHATTARPSEPVGPRFPITSGAALGGYSAQFAAMNWWRQGWRVARTVIQLRVYCGARAHLPSRPRLPLFSSRLQVVCTHN